MSSIRIEHLKLVLVTLLISMTELLKRVILTHCFRRFQSFVVGKAWRLKQL